MSSFLILGIIVCNFIYFSERCRRRRLVANQLHSYCQRQRRSHLHLGFCTKNGRACHDVYVQDRRTLLTSEIF